MAIKTRKNVKERSKPSLRSVLIEGILEGEHKGEDVAVGKAVDSTVVCAAIDGIGSAKDPKGAAERWARLLSKISLKGLANLPAGQLVSQIKKKIRKLATEELGPSYEEQLRDAVFSAVFSTRKGNGWRHIFIWNGDGGIFFKTGKGAEFPRASSGTIRLPFDVLKGLNDKNAVIPNRVFDGQKEICENDDFFHLLYSEELLFKEFKGKGSLMVYTDGLRDAFFGWYAENGGDIHDPAGLEKRYVEFMTLVIEGKFSKEQLKEFAHKASAEPSWDDITYVVAEF